MFDRLQEIENRYIELEKELGDPEIIGDREQFQKIAKEHSDLEEIVSKFRELKQNKNQTDETRILIQDSDPDIREMASLEMSKLTENKERLENAIKLLLLPKDPNDDKNVVLEIRAGTGGDEAALFAADIFRMYSRFAERKRWKLEVLSESPTGIGGYKEIICLISGDRVFSRLKYEGGTHRVQRVPETEAQGRIHTSAITVAVMPEADEVECQIDPSELKIDVYRASGAGGQHVNKTESAVRITHLPTGLVVQCQDERSQHKNKSKAMKVLTARFMDAKRQEHDAQLSAERKAIVGSGDRSERIRTYNFPQGRMTDHRIGLTLYRLESIMDGDIDEISETLRSHYQAMALAGQG